MRYLSSLLFVIVVITFYSCTSSTENKDSESEQNEEIETLAANWNDTTTMGKVINRYYEDSLLKDGKIAMEIEDPLMNSRLPYRYPQIQKVLRPRFKKVSPTVGYMPVLMTTSKDSVIVDFQITWKKGEFVVTDKFLQKVGNEPRYEWIENDGYWVRRDVIDEEK
ncbi:hypothetical protein [Bernardetia sp. MNP-M8]|uniref:hypothetical protein n=1 Tax=Bernardetia sp. MNP-M8 TaxID=3127470 RepID=UPI0030D0D832